MRTGKAIHAKLDDVYQQAGTKTFDLKTGGLVIFSDQHKGARDGADDFQRCERAYNAALAYYDHLKYDLVLLGDVEELWENTFDEVAARYKTTLELEAAFHARKRYTRLWGNHDIAWSDPELFQERMSAHGVGDAVPVEAVRLVVQRAGGTSVGELLLAHGHQGTASSDRYARLSRFFVRHGWRRLQRHLDRPWNTPAVDWALRGEHALHMAAWAEKHRRVLITGHTHLPVFFGTAKEPTSAAPVSSGRSNMETEALALARTRWAEAETARLVSQQPSGPPSRWYFNTGCCSFGDGDITGIEMSGGKIRLIRWPCHPETEAQVLGVPLDLEDVLSTGQ